ncbi:MAG: (2Fe-2S)-binding protein [Treponema sp.]|nr:(2Fe-2S)-binding protein [Treponema sp.]
MALVIKINGKTYSAEKGEYVLDVCRRNLIFIPTLCHHEGLPGLGSCRLCVVEINEGSGNRVVVSCIYPFSRDCEVFTESDKVLGIRKTILSMLRTRAPEGEGLSSLCQLYGVAENERFTVPKIGKDGAAEKRMASACVLCGLCAQACATLGTGAISTTGRGVSKKISTPFDEPSEDCVGCASCAEVCPTKAIERTEAGGVRSIWGRDFELIRCACCGKAFATKEEYAFALRTQEKTGQEEESAVLCEDCRKKKSADILAAAFGSREM